MKNYDGSCQGDCYRCLCQLCEGNCAMRCMIDSRPEKIAKMPNDESCVIRCQEFTKYEEVPEKDVKDYMEKVGNEYAD